MATPQAPVEAPILAADEATVARVCALVAPAARLALDVEGSGMHAYRAQVCTLQLAWASGSAVAIVDALAVPLAPLRDVLGPEGPVKIVHDVAFDARILAESGILLGRVHDTSVAARMLGRSATGLSALLDAELGVHVEKALQHHDWRIRPLDDRMRRYLTEDVQHLEALESKLWKELEEKAIGEAVLEETRYRIECAAAGARDARDEPAYFRVKGVEKLRDRELAALRAVAEVREREAKERDVPPHRVASAEALVLLAKTRPNCAAEVARVRGVDAGPGSVAFLDEVARALTSAPEAVPDDEWRRLFPPKPPAEEVRSRKEREARLLAWRRREAARRGVDEQVLLPGHCLRDAAASNAASADDLAAIPGIGRFRVQRDGESILRVLRAEEPSA
jgi:ribonuclease D